MPTRNRTLGEGTLADRRPDPAVSRIRLGNIDVVDGFHEHGSVTHHHEQGNVKHKHRTHDMSTDSDGTLVPDPR